VFAELIETVRPATVVELGASALHMAAAARNLSLSWTILCVDDFRGWHGDALLLPQFMAGGEETRVLPLPISTASALAACASGACAPTSSRWTPATTSTLRGPTSTSPGHHHSVRHVTLFAKARLTG
jgi:hypothetical protein